MRFECVFGLPRRNSEWPLDHTRWTHDGSRAPWTRTHATRTHAHTLHPGRITATRATMAAGRLRRRLLTALAVLIRRRTIYNSAVGLPARVQPQMTVPPTFHPRSRAATSWTQRKAWWGYPGDRRTEVVRRALRTYPGDRRTEVVRGALRTVARCPRDESSPVGPLGAATARVHETRPRPRAPRADISR